MPVGAHSLGEFLSNAVHCPTSFRQRGNARTKIEYRLWPQIDPALRLQIR